MTPRGKDRPERIHALFGDERMARSPQFVELKQAHGMLIRAIQRDDKDGVRAAHARCAALAPAEFEAFYEGFALRAGIKAD